MHNMCHTCMHLDVFTSFFESCGSSCQSNIKILVDWILRHANGEAQSQQDCDAQGYLFFLFCCMRSANNSMLNFGFCQTIYHMQGLLTLYLLLPFHKEFYDDFFTADSSYRKRRFLEVAANYSIPEDRVLRCLQEGRVS